MQTRRSLLLQAASLSAGIVVPAKFLLAQAAPEPLPLTPSQQPPAKLPSDFVGLGYEMSSVATIGLLSPSNYPYVNLVKGLGSSGVLRVGGIVADYTRYESDGAIKATPKDTVITRASLEELGRFLKATGWKAIWSVNFAQGTLNEAVEEARNVAAVLGDRLLCLELGNEVENYKNGVKPFRQPPYAYETYRQEFNQWRAAIIKAVPGARFAVPDTAANVEWVERMAKDAKGDVQLLTTHYYFTSQNHGKAEDLLQPDPRLIGNLTRLRTAATESHIPWRMCQTNSFSGGGLRGVSDTFLGALWTLDYMLLLAAYGCSGVNIETGINQLGFVSSYSPIQDDGHGSNSAGIPYYGMLAFAEACRGSTEIAALQVPATNSRLTGYTLGNAGRSSTVVLINRAEGEARVSLVQLDQLGLHGHLHALWLKAPSEFSKAGVTLAGSSVEEDGTWRAKRMDSVKPPSLNIPAMSAVILRI